jgi:hypothetical protein
MKMATTTTSCLRVLLREEAVTSEGDKKYDKAHVKREDVIVAALNQDTVSPDTRMDCIMRAIDDARKAAEAVKAQSDYFIALMP